MPIIPLRSTCLELFAKLAPDQIEADFSRELQEIEAESIGWTPLDPGAYLHTGSEQPAFIEIVGQACVSMAADNVLWLV
jgi:hypothetical protein